MSTASPLHVAEPEVEKVLQEKMTQIALKEKEQVTAAVATQLGLGYINLVGFPIGPETIALLPRAEAERVGVLCFLKTTNQIRLGAIDPTHPELQPLIDTLGHKHHANVEVYVISQHSFETAIKLYDRLPKIRKVTSDLEIAAEDVERYRQQIHDIRDLETYLEKTSVTDTFVLLLAGALQGRASDIHIEAEASGIRVRFRIDGILVPVATLKRETWPRIISRIKLMAGLKINITSTPQDGRITVYVLGDKVDIRVSTLPTAFGESVVMRLLRSTATTITFDELGLRDRAYEQLVKEIERPNGMVVVTGPTGSGKTTSLYAVLNRLNKPDSKIITLEDPIEYKLEGINQSQVDWSKGYTFAAGLRSILRQDPDVVMVGEIRDLETADTAIQAALTGHLVLSTIHTNDAAGAIPRFLSMGTKPYLLAPALNAVVAQRLVRKICTSCQTDDVLDEAIQQRVKETLAAIPANSGYAVAADRPLEFRKGTGCDQCHGLGYFGRVGIFEVLVVNDDLEKVILSSQASEYQMREVANRQGMITMAQDGLLKALDGITTVEEVFRVAQ
ncbi:MAG: type II/IV secretion system protein [Candidatus Kerfeldbacteria bacterium]|nr:type II/IV secretion system protein [Candidatus Kerfeldbacteria bacterium]